MQNILSSDSFVQQDVIHEVLITVCLQHLSY